MWSPTFGGLWHAVSSPDSGDGVTDARPGFNKRLSRTNTHLDGFGINVGRADRGREWLQACTASLGGLHDGYNVSLTYFVCKANALHGQVQPLHGHRVEHGQVCQHRRIEIGQLLHTGLTVEGDVPGIEGAALTPTWTPPPVIAHSLWHWWAVIRHASSSLVRYRVGRSWRRHKYAWQRAHADGAGWRPPRRHCSYV